MERNRARNCGLCALTGLIVVAMMLPCSSLAGDKMKPEEIVAKHLESIGTAEARAAVHNRIIGGTVVATYSSPGTARFMGKAVMASEGSKHVIGMGFESNNYSHENIGFDGENVTVGYVRPGVRSNLGDLVTTYKAIVKSGILGGTLSQAWPLLASPEKKYKLESSGTKKIGGKALYELRFIPRGGSDMEINLFFDSETFQHVRTEYELVIAAQLGANVDASASQRTTRYKMVEEFSDFKKEEGLTLPHEYKIILELDTRGASFRANWALTLVQFAFNQTIQPEMYNVGSK